MRLKRSPREIAARAKQELINLALFLRPTRLRMSGIPASPLPGLPDPKLVAAHLRQTSYAEDIRVLSSGIVSHRIPLFGRWIDTGPTVAWRRDYWSGRETGLQYFRRVPYLDPLKAGDHKVIWELNRHQHLVLLAQAALLENSAPSDELWKQLDGWIEANPFHRGINWASALEVAFRTLSWLWIYHLAGDRMPESLRRRFLETLYRHGRHLEINLSFYFSPNTHLLGEAVALHALGALFPAFPGAGRWAKLGSRIVERQIALQVRPDGGHFEQSTYYHVYALDMFLFHAVLAPVSDAYRATLTRMADYLNALSGPSRELPFLGDDDGGRFFHPFGKRAQFGRASLAVAAQFLGNSNWTYEREDLWPIASWWLGRTDGKAAGEHDSRYFPDTGIAVMTSGPHQVIVDAGPFGPWSAGHSHSDTLSLVVKSAEEEVLIDPGTYVYAAAIACRNAFRGSASHNTIRIDGLDQAKPGGMFGWMGRPEVRIHSWVTTPEFDRLDASCSYSGFRHRRCVHFVKAGVILLLDEIDGPAGEHEIEQFWHAGSEGGLRRLVLEMPAEKSEGWRSTVYGTKEAAPVACVRRRTLLPCRIGVGILLTEDSRLEMAADGSSIRFCWYRGGTEPVTIIL